MRRVCLLLIALLSPLLAQVKIRYLANEGVLLSAGESRILIDALFRDSLDDYARHDAQTLESLESGKPPFDHVTLALATHYHLDHWDAGAVTRFLSLNPQARFASTPQGVAMLPRSQRSQFQALWRGGDAAAAVDVAGAHVEALPLQHGQTQNLGYRVSMGHRVVVHLGDAEPSPQNFDALQAWGAPDVVLAPFWWLLDEQGLDFLTKRWKARSVVAFHFGARDAMESAPKVSKSVPAAWLCTHAGDSRTF